MSLDRVHGCPLLGLGSGPVVLWPACVVSATLTDGRIWDPGATLPLPRMLWQVLAHQGQLSEVAHSSSVVGGSVGWRCGPWAHGALGPALGSHLVPWHLCSMALGALPLLGWSMAFL